MKSDPDYSQNSGFPYILALDDTKQLCPKFSRKLYFDKLIELSSKKPIFGSDLFFAETTTSTQTLLDNNSTFSSLFKSGTVFLALNQTAGRGLFGHDLGRGTNGWISQEGCLQFSIRLFHNHARSAVFIQ
jgi:hypothetical protein